MHVSDKGTHICVCVCTTRNVTPFVTRTRTRSTARLPRQRAHVALRLREALMHASARETPCPPHPRPIHSDIFVDKR